MSSQSLKSKFFNWYGVLDDKESPTLQDTKYIEVCKTRSEINKLLANPYIDSLGLKGEGILEVHIYDFSKVIQKKELKTRKDYEDILNENFSITKDYENTFKALGQDVTHEFDIILGKIAGSKNVQIKSNKTATQAPEDKRQSINAETGDFNLEIGNLEGTIQTKNNVQVSLSNGTPYFPNPFSGRIIDSSIRPAFNVEKIAKVFANHLMNLHDENGQMVGVFGKWGRGKTYFVKKVCEALDIDFKEESSGKGSDFIFIKFQAWKYQSTPAIWAYLYETISKKYFSKNWFVQKCQLLKLSVKRTGHFDSYILPLATLLLGIIWYLVLFPRWDTLLSKIGGLIPLSYSAYRLIDFYIFSKRPARKLIKSATSKPSFEHILGPQAEIQKELIYLLKAWEKRLEKRKRKCYYFGQESQKEKRLLLFVDDLDRCSEKRIVEIIDAIRVMLDDSRLKKRLVVIAALDEGILKGAIKQKYKRKEEKNIDVLVREYMDKLFISSIKLAQIPSEKRSVFVDYLIEQINLENSPMIDIPGNSPAGININHIEKNKEIIPDPYSVPNELLDDSLTQEELDAKTNSIQKFETDLLKRKISKVSKELTPRQIRILVFRYLLARNISISLYGDNDFKYDQVVDRIIEESFEEKLGEKTNAFYDEIVKMVVAY